MKNNKSKILLTIIRLTTFFCLLTHEFCVDFQLKVALLSLVKHDYVKNYFIFHFICLHQLDI